jgi:hypothetical protein
MRSATSPAIAVPPPRRSARLAVAAAFPAMIAAVVRGSME